MPVPQVEEPERFPGGADALCDRLGYGEITTLPLGVDLPTYPAGQPSGDSFRRRRATRVPRRTLMRDPNGQAGHPLAQLT